MKKEITIPEGVQVEMVGNDLKARGVKGEMMKKFYHPRLLLSTEGGKIKIETKDEKKKTLATVGTWTAHLKNIFRGVTRGYEYRMKISHVHFPMNVSVQGNKLIIKNFLGQKMERQAKLVEGVNVKVDGDEIVLSGVDREKVGQTAGNIETRLGNRRDRRIFSDGIFIISKGDNVG